MLGPRIDIHAQNPFYETMEILYRLLFHGLSEIKIDIYLIQIFKTILQLLFYDTKTRFASR